jgi:hypothetical protein
LAAFVVVISFWAFVSYYTFQTYSDEWLLSQVKILVHAPKFISANEDEEFRFAIQSLENADISVLLFLVNGGSSKSMLGLTQSNFIYSGKVRTQEQVNRHLKIFLPWEGDSRPFIGLSLWGGVNDTPPEKIADFPIGSAPIPWAKSMSNYLGIALVGLVFGLFKDLLDQFLEDKKTK